ncbi:unnamed protein product [Cyprideis torosa]|uniref:Uncharacterized protein n=1 Tax=Cyprideis torosa TaxID=163714 RepID=A0A7R8W7W2_9CRUS|nr:unnamed protein product [Cyprideis torosa]CAG0886787.1 unnamed protein product [Cyprideis torosa]
MYKLVLSSVLLAVAMADKLPSIILGRGSDSNSGEDRVVRVGYGAPRRVSYGSAESDPAIYSFNWVVRDDYSGIDMGHQEDRNGDNTKGSYRVLLPDGRTQIVTYRVDGDSGYLADVQYEGEARFSSEERTPSRSYARPVLVKKDSSESAEAVRPVIIRTSAPRRSYSRPILVRTAPRRSYGVPVVNVVQRYD